jgi:membrane protease YdiL (CAAX protease family)
LNSFPENAEPVPVTASEAVPPRIPDAPPAIVKVAPQDPPWSGWDVLRILLMGVVALFATVIVLLLVSSGSSLKGRANALGAHPELEIIGQMGAYVALLGYMYILVTKERHCPRFWDAIQWNWPKATSWYLLGGVLLQAIFLVIEWKLKRFIPKETPFDALMRRPYTVALIAIFSITLGPLMEELFFRGFLYPVLKRRFGVIAGVLVTALGFGLVHASQYGYSWLSVLLISVVGVVLAVVRENKNSVAAGFLVHVGYNATIMTLLFAATDGFRHMEKLNQ